MQTYEGKKGQKPIILRAKKPRFRPAKEKEKRSRESEEEERRRREKLLTSSGLTAGRKMSILAVTFSKVQLHQYNF